MHTAAVDFLTKFGVFIMVSLKRNNINRQNNRKGLFYNYNKIVTKITLAKTRWLFQILSGVASDLQILCLVHGSKCLIINFLKFILLKHF